MSKQPTRKQIIQDYILELGDQLEEVQKTYNDRIELAEVKLHYTIKFPFFIQYHPSDGLCIVHNGTKNVALLKTCFNIIKEKGELLLTDFQKISR